MKKFLLLVALMAIIHSSAFPQSCLPNGITFSTQQQIDNFPTNYPGCKSTCGRLTISGSNITNLNGLNQLTSANSIYIYKNNALATLYGLHNITTVYDLHIGTIEIMNRGGNPLLTSLTGLDALTHISNELEIYDNDAISSLSGLGKLTFIGRNLSISENENLSSIASLKNLNTIGYAGSILFYGDAISIHNTSLVTLEGLENLTNFRGGINISQNPVLTSIIGIENIAIDLISSLTIHDNPSLVTSNLGNLCNYLKNPKGAVNIYNNAAGCNSPVEMAKACGIPVPYLPYGNYYFLSQSDINNFRIDYPECKQLGGKVRIKGNDIVSLSGLNKVSSIDGDLEIDSCKLLVNLAGLDSLTSVGSSIYIASNGALSGLTGLDNLKTVGWGFSISHNPLLTNLVGLEKLTSTTGGLRIQDNKKLTSLNGLDNLSSTHWLDIYDNPKLTSIASLKNLTSVTGNHAELWIWNNYALESLEGLHNITTVDGSLSILSNTVLKNLNGLKKITTINGSLEIANNSALTNLAGLENLNFIEFDLWLLFNDSIRNLTGLENLNSLGRSLWIFDNPSLVSLEGIENMDTASISDLYISENFALSDCAIKSICAYLAKPDAIVTIENNSEGCNTAEELKTACNTVGIENVEMNQRCLVFPNPFSKSVVIEYFLEESAVVSLTIFNHLGQEIDMPVNEQQVNGKHVVIWNAENLPVGIYYCRLQAGGQIKTVKIVKMK